MTLSSAVRPSAMATTTVATEPAATVTVRVTGLRPAAMMVTWWLPGLTASGRASGAAPTGVPSIETWAAAAPSTRTSSDPTLGLSRASSASTSARRSASTCPPYVRWCSSRARTASAGRPSSPRQTARL